MRTAVAVVLLALPALADSLQLGALAAGPQASVASRVPAVSRRSTAPALVAASGEAARPDSEAVKTWTARINRVSTFASILCAIDCTVLPILLLMLPVAGSSAWLHKAAHAVSLYFVLPVGGGAVTANFAQHRKPLLGLWGVSGLLLIALANVHLPHGLVSHAVDELLHKSHEVINVVGCGLLLSSQWVSHRVLHAMGKDCGHDHGHAACGHDHDH